MRRKDAKLRSAQFGNPFVVLTDVTIALAFIFAIVALYSQAVYANSLNGQLAKKLDRDKWQREMVIDAQKVLKTTFPTWKRKDSTNATDRTPKYLFYEGKEPKEDNDESCVASIWQNGNFLRIRIWKKLFANPVRTPSGTWQHPPMRGTVDLYKKLGQMIGRYRNNQSYVFLHGISGTGDPKDAADEVSLSRSRMVGNIWKINEIAKDLDEKSPDKGILDSKYIIEVGTGRSTYFNADRPGRVEILVFFKDVSNG